MANEGISTTPWRLQEAIWHQYDREWRLIIGAKGECIAFVNRWVGEAALEADKNAAFIASAPELSEKVRQIEVQYQELQKQLNAEVLLRIDLTKALADIAAIPPTGDGGMMRAQNLADEALAKRNHESGTQCGKVLGHPGPIKWCGLQPNHDGGCVFVLSDRR